jgi:hypothetical protein
MAPFPYCCAPPSRPAGCAVTTDCRLAGRGLATKPRPGRPLRSIVGYFRPLTIGGVAAQACQERPIFRAKRGLEKALRPPLRRIEHAGRARSQALAWPVSPARSDRSTWVYGGYQPDLRFVLARAKRAGASFSFLFLQLASITSETPAKKARTRSGDL